MNKSQRKPLVAGNWKMNGSRQSVACLLNELKQALANIDSNAVDLCVFPAFPFLQQTQAALTGSNIRWGAQTVSAQAQGAFTGDVAASMLTEFGCEAVLLGHSECRQYHHETNALLLEKFQQVVKVGLQPVLCVGETLAEREQGRTEAVVSEQVCAILQHGGQGLQRLVIAYEPVWAIGTGKTATPAEAQAVHAHIRQLVTKYDARLADQIQIIYGGSVNAGNAQQLFAMPDIDGGLIGGASLKAAEFATIYQAALK